MSAWAREEDRLLLLELAITGRTKERVAQETSLRHLADLSWIVRTPRAQEWSVHPTFVAHVHQLLDREWPAWRDVREALLAAGLPPTPAGFAGLRDRERAARAKELPPRLHEKTFAAITGAHSKVGQALRRAPALDGTQLTTDQVVRLRPSPGLTIVHGERALDAMDWADANGGEVVLTQRALLSGARLGGAAPRAIVTIENLGAYLDFTPPPGVLLLHVPGWDTALARLLLGAATAPLVHFGDLDLAGVRIAAHLRELFPALRWWVPSFAPEYFDAHALACEWAELPADSPPPIAALARAGRWLEQEVLVLDPRGAMELEAMIAAGS